MKKKYKVFKIVSKACTKLLSQINSSVTAKPNHTNQLQILDHAVVAVSKRVPIILASRNPCLYVVPTPSQWIGLFYVANRTL